MGNNYFGKLYIWNMISTSVHVFSDTPSTYVYNVHICFWVNFTTISTYLLLMYYFT